MTAPVRAKPRPQTDKPSRYLARPSIPAVATGAPKALLSGELSRATMLRKPAAAFQHAPMQRAAAAMPRTGISDEALATLQKLASKNGAVKTIDVQTLAARMQTSAAQSLLKTFQTLTKVKAEGSLTVARGEPSVTAELLQQVASGKASPRLCKHTQRLAREELIRLFPGEGSEKRLRALLQIDLRKRYGTTVPMESDNPLNSLPMSERDERRGNALLALLFDAKLPVSMKPLVIEKLAVCGGASALPVLASLQKREPALAAKIGLTMSAIQKAGKMTLVFAAMEVAPYAATGGLGSVMAELPKALASLGHRVIVVSPRHGITDPKKNHLEPTGLELDVPTPGSGMSTTLLRADKDGVEHYFVENHQYFSNRFGVYADPNGAYGDEAERYDFFSKAIPAAVRAVLGDEKPDLVQLNDAHTGPAAAYLKADPTLSDVKTVMAVHNMGAAYQGRFGHHKLADTGLEQLGLYYPTGPLEFNDTMNFLKLGLTATDAAIVVSRQYKNETMDTQGEGLEGVMRALDFEGRLHGNMNGIDTSTWNPATDPAIAANYSLTDRSGKGVCKTALQKRLGLPQQLKTPLIGVVSRVTAQKGIDDVIQTIEARMHAKQDVQFVICGKGEEHLLSQLRGLQAKYPKNVRIDSDFTKAKEREVLAGSDLFLMPSRFEPCGLPQMYAMQYLTPPIVRAVGGLEESVHTWDKASRTGNGFKFQNDVDAAVRGALEWYAAKGRDREDLLKNCASEDFSWHGRAALEQLAIYRDTINTSNQPSDKQLCDAAIGDADASTDPLPPAKSPADLIQGRLLARRLSSPATFPMARADRDPLGTPTRTYDDTSRRPSHEPLAE